MAAWWRTYIARRARQMGLDPQAVLAVAAQEGLSGGVGDAGTSYGPFQLHRGGALPRGRNRSWAESPAGIDYALQQIAGVARGQRGQQAISSIVSRFERPANPRAEIAGALRSYGGITPAAGAVASSVPSSAAVPAAPDLSGLRANVLAALINASGQHSPDYTPVFSALSALRRGRTKSAAPPSTVGGFQTGRAPRAGSSLSFLTPFASRYGLSITSTTGGHHVTNSYHYQGRAVDFGGNPAHMAALQHYALAHPRQFVEAFYSGRGAAPYFVKNGKVYPIAQLDPSVRAHHKDHVHLAH